MGLSTLAIVLTAIFYMVAGANHFLKPRIYLAIMPPVLPAPRLLNYAAGAAELTFGVLLLWPATRFWAAWGIVALLVAVFPANVYMLQIAHRFSVPRWALWARLPLQGVLIAWAWLIAYS